MAPVREVAAEDEPSDVVEEVTASVATLEPEVHEALEETPTPIVAVGEDNEKDASGEVLPLHKWIQSATQSDDESAAADWPHLLLSRRRPPRSE